MMYWKFKAIVNIGDIYMCVNKGEIDTILMSKLAEKI